MYGKIFSKMYEGSMVGIGPDVFALWGYCIAKADPDEHTVEINPTLLACIIGMPVARVQKALKTLLAPDPDSHSQEAGGARLTHVTGHRYHVTTHEEYRGINDHDAMRAYMRDAKRKQRAKSQGKQGELPFVKDSQRQSKNPVSVYVSEDKGDCKGEKIPTVPEIDWKDVLIKWNYLAEKNGLPGLKKITEGRKKKYRARTDDGRTQEEFWQILELELARLDDWCLGRTERKWIITFDYIVRSDDTLTKLEEGHCRRKKAKATRTPGANTNRLDLP
ncbi:MAG: hypothetical protein ACYSUV_16985 [Planctomycetota bacterium]|jgi:hypothetical protein